MSYHPTCNIFHSQQHVHMELLEVEIVLIILLRCTKVMQEIMLTEMQFFIIQTRRTLKVGSVYYGTNAVVGTNIISCHFNLSSVKLTGILKSGNLYNQQMLKFKILDLLLNISNLRSSTSLSSNNLTMHSR